MSNRSAKYFSTSLRQATLLNSSATTAEAPTVCKAQAMILQPCEELVRRPWRMIKTTRPSAQPPDHNRHHILWEKDLGGIFSDMVKWSGLRPETTHIHKNTFNQLVIPSLGSHPDGVRDRAGPVWTSFMNDDHTPIEFSWSWKPRSRLPTLRYGLEAIGPNAGSVHDCFNTKQNLALAYDLGRQNPRIDFAWFHHFAHALLPEESSSEGSNLQRDHPSQLFLAFELGERGTSLKAYFVPLQRSRQERCSPLDLLGDSLRSLPQRTPTLLHAFGRIRNYIQAFDHGQQPQVEMLAIDCISYSQARIKIYIRSPETSFGSVLRAMTLAGQLPPLPEHAVESLRDLWKLILNPDHQMSDEEPLPANHHRTAGIIYHFDLRLDKPLPSCKVYIPAKHYGKNDHDVAAGFEQFLAARNKGLHSTSYRDAVTKLCSHRRLDEGLGFHTYISAAIDGDDLAVTSYIQPEIYHPSRRNITACLLDTNPNCFVLKI